MRSVEEHLQAVLAGVVPLSPLDVSLVEARACVLAEDVTAPWPLPAFDNAAVDAAFFPDGQWKSNFLINIGYGVSTGTYPRGPRLGFDAVARIA